MTRLQLDRLLVLPMRSAGSARVWHRRRPGCIVVAVAPTWLANVDCLQRAARALAHTASAPSRKRARRSNSP
jgi:hypothetical protein